MISILAMLMVTLAPVQDPEPRAAFFHTGITLLRICSKENDDLSLGQCVGYIDAILDESLLNTTYQRPRRICVSQEVTSGQVRSAVLRVLRGDQDGLRLPALIYVERAIATTWPCPADH